MRLKSFSPVYWDFQGKDDVTGEPLIQHDDDKPEALMARLRHYKDVAKPVIDLYKLVKTFLFGGLWNRWYFPKLPVQSL